MTKLILAGLLAFASAASGQTVLYDTFNDGDPDDLFDCCNVLYINGKIKHQTGSHDVAVPFTPIRDGRVIEIDLALSFFFGDRNAFKVRLLTDSGDLPGGLKHAWQLKDAPLGGQCCTFEDVHARDEGQGARLKAGKTYWIEVSATSSVEAGWNLNTVGITGGYAEQRGSGGWGIGNGLLPALRIIGSSSP